MIEYDSLIFFMLHSSKYFRKINLDNIFVVKMAQDIIFK